MSGDWIKMRCALADDPSVISIAASTNLDEDTVVGKLHKLWSWADRQLINGNAAGVTESWIDRYLGVTGFARSMVNAGWLVIHDRGIELPNFERHNLKTGKERALTALRVARHKKKSNGKSNAHTVTSPLPTEEKRREEKISKNTDPPLPPLGEPERVEVRPYVYLSKSESDRWLEKISPAELGYWCDQLSATAAQNPKAWSKKYKNHSLVISQWRNRRLEDGKIWNEAKGHYEKPGFPVQFARRGAVTPNGHSESFNRNIELIRMFENEEKLENEQK